MLKSLQFATAVGVCGLVLYLDPTANYVGAGFLGLIAALAATRIWMAARHRARLVHGPGKGEFHFVFPEPKPPPPTVDVLPPEPQHRPPELPASERRRGSS